jgi:hypothetical protein
VNALCRWVDQPNEFYAEVEVLHDFVVDIA